MKNRSQKRLSIYREIEEEKRVESAEEARPHRRGGRMISGCLASLVYLMLLFGISLLLAVGGLSCANDMFALVKEPAEISLTLTQDTDLDQMAAKLKEGKIIRYPFLFKFYMRLKDKENALVPGTYTVNSSMDYRALAAQVGERVTVRQSIDVIIPEGYTQNEIFALLEGKGVCAASELQEAARSYDFHFKWLSSREKTEKRLEGFLFPDTYTFYIDDNAPRVLNKFLSNFSKKYDVEFKTRASELGTSLEDIMIIASMIEKEAKTDEDRPYISSVIYNRLASSAFPCLQIDATVIYALGEHKEALTQDDLKIDSPYNTYVRKGLPVGAICNPGLESIAAALYPEETGYYFYVAKPDGSHIFTETLRQHQKAIEDAKKLWEEAARTTEEE